MLCTAAAHQTLLRLRRRPELLERNAPDRRLRLFLHLRLAVRTAAPAGVDEPTGPFDDLAHSAVFDHTAVRIVFPPLPRTREQRVLHLLQPARHAIDRR